MLVVINVYEGQELSEGLLSVKGAQFTNFEKFEWHCRHILFVSGMDVSGAGMVKLLLT